MFGGMPGLDGEAAPNGSSNGEKRRETAGPVAVGARRVGSRAREEEMSLSSTSMSSRTVGGASRD